MACTDPGACTLNIEPGITVRALEAGTGKNVTDSAQGAVSEGASLTVYRPAQVDAAGRVQLLSAADERAGTYDVFVERPGYQAVYSFAGPGQGRRPDHVEHGCTGSHHGADPLAGSPRVLSNTRIQPTSASKPSAVEKRSRRCRFNGT